MTIALMALFTLICRLMYGAGYYIVPAKLDWTRPSGFCDTPASFPGTPFIARVCHVPNHLPFRLEVPACLLWWTSRGAVMCGDVGLCKMEPPRRRFAGRFAVVLPFAKHGRRQINPSSGALAIKPGKSKRIAARNRQPIYQGRDVLLPGLGRAGSVAIRRGSSAGQAGNFVYRKN